MKSDMMLVDGDQWRLFNLQAQCDVVKPFPRLESPARLLVHFGDAFTGLLRFEGQTKFARALIERQVRREGWIEGPSHIVIHRLFKTSGGGQAFYTAIPLDTWQQLLDWVRRQRDHCLVYPTGALLADVNMNQGRILRLGRRLLMFARDKHGLVFEDVYSATTGMDDLQLAAQTLGANIAELDRQADRQNRHRYEWLTAAEEDDDAIDTAIMDTLQQAGDVKIDRVMPRRFRTRQDSSGQDSLNQGALSSALPLALNRLGARESSNTGVEKVAWWSESMAPAVMTTIGVLAIGIGVAGTFAHQLAKGEWAQSETLMSDVRDKRTTIQQVQFDDYSNDLTELANFATRLNQGAPYTPTQVLDSVRSAAVRGLTIYRVHLESSRRSGYQLRVDGVSDGANSDAVRIFLSTLRGHGWRPVPLEPSASEPGSFSYRLEPESLDL